MCKCNAISRYFPHPFPALNKNCAYIHSTISKVCRHQTAETSDGFLSKRSKCKREDEKSGNLSNSCFSRHVPGLIDFEMLKIKQKASIFNDLAVIEFFYFLECFFFLTEYEQQWKMKCLETLKGVCLHFYAHKHIMYICVHTYNDDFGVRNTCDVSRATASE